MLGMVPMYYANVSTECDRRRSGLPSAPLDMIWNMTTVVQSVIEEDQHGKQAF